jgi:hypothetical protein
MHLARRKSRQYEDRKVKNTRFCTKRPKNFKCDSIIEEVTG